MVSLQNIMFPALLTTSEWLEGKINPLLRYVAQPDLKLELILSI